ncbi:MAG: hypothetical protein GX349_07105 [Firmicutes bacterium]|nr:hypothetical protein [Bacillota bacterium]
MRGERIKTIILILLVGLSMAQTGLLWYGLRPLPAPTLTPPPGQAQLGEEKETMDLITPTRAFLSLGEGRYALLSPSGEAFGAAWKRVAAKLRQEETWLQREWEPLPQAPDLELPGTYQWEFPLTLRLDYHRDLLLSQPGPARELPPLAHLILSPSKDAYVHDGEGNYYPFLLGMAGAAPGAEAATWAPEDPGLLYQGPQGGDPSYAPGVYLPAGELSLPTLKAVVEKLPADSVTGTFFADMSLVRTIQERDGALIYTDGQRALRLYPSGVLEYGYPSLRAKGPSLPPAAAFERGRHFVDQHGGWPAEVRLSTIRVENRPDGQHYQLTYRQYEGDIPLLLPAPALSLSVHSGGVTDYGRQVVTTYPLEAAQALVDPQELLPELLASPALQENLEEGEEAVISALYPAYYGQAVGERDYILKPVWVVKVAGQEYYFAGHGGEALSSPGAQEGGEGHGLGPG